MQSEEQIKHIAPYKVRGLQKLHSTKSAGCVNVYRVLAAMLSLYDHWTFCSLRQGLNILLQDNGMILL